VLVWLMFPHGPDSDIAPKGSGAEDLQAQVRVQGSRANLPYAARLAEVRRSLPPGHIIVASPPYIVVGDQPRKVVTRHVAQNIHWSGRHLKRLYFPRDPTRPIEIWLLSSPQSYAKATLSLFGRPPSTPYGFYVADRRTMVMNIQTGGGTLVHELVHAYMAANFPDCPTWLNEGLGSLYEMVGERKGRIWGYVNWRLPVLQKAIAQGRVVPLTTLLGMSAEQFYSGPTGLHYAEARYLLYYLQVKGLLVGFYRRLRSRQPTDNNAGPTVLREVLGERSLVTFQKKWEAFVRELRVSYEVQVTVGDAQVRTFDPKQDRE